MVCAEDTNLIVMSKDDFKKIVNEEGEKIKR